MERILRVIGAFAALTTLAACQAGGEETAAADVAAVGKAPEQGYVPEAWYPHEGGLLQYRVAIRFGMEPVTAPAGFDWGRMSGVTHDANGNIYALHRGTSDNIVVFDSAGTYLRSFGKGIFGNAHGLRIDRQGNLWATDNADHQIFKFTLDGKLLQTWGEKGVSGADETHFGRPADLAWDSQGNTYIADGYLNRRVVKLDPQGNFVKAWGEEGTGPGQFGLPHSIGVDSRDRIYVSDRANNRIQIFDVDGNFIEEWKQFGATQGIFITPNDEMWIITHRNAVENVTYDTLAGRLMKVNPMTGELLGSMESPGHLLTVTPKGEIFVASLTGNIFRWYPDASRWEPAQ